MLNLTAATNTTVLVGASILVLAANARRKYSVITNGSDVAVWLSFGEAAVVGQGVYLGAGGGSYEIDADNMFRGDIYGIASTGSSKVVGIVDFQ